MLSPCTHRKTPSLLSATTYYYWKTVSRHSPPAQAFSPLSCTNPASLSCESSPTLKAFTRPYPIFQTTSKLWGPKLYTVFQVCPNKCCIEWSHPLICSLPSYWCSPGHSLPSLLQGRTADSCWASLSSCPPSLFQQSCIPVSLAPACTAAWDYSIPAWLYIYLC